MCAVVFFSKKNARRSFPYPNDKRVEIFSNDIETKIVRKFKDIINTIDTNGIEEKIEEIKQLKESSPDCDAW